MSMTDFGSKLREARERRGISLRQIADSTKISASALDALERNDISRLPGGIFSRAFVRSYAAAVGLDPEQTVREFLERFQAEPAPAVPKPTAMTEEESNFESQQRMAGVVLTIVLISIPIVVVILYFSFRSRGAETVQPSAAAVHESTRAAHPPAAVPQPADAAPAAPMVPASSAPAPAGATPAGVMTLELHPTGPCWISVTVDGTRVLSRLMQPGEKEMLQVRDAAVIEIGDAGAFAFSIDGRPGKLLGDSGEVKTLRITKETAGQFFR
jgi:cytoskeleton protein RodZ